MEKSLLFATHIALKRLLFDNNIWNMFAYIPGNRCIYDNFSHRWKIKTQCFYKSTGNLKYDALKYYDPDKDKFMPIVFDFGTQALVHYAGIAVLVVILQNNHILERLVVERICELSDAGFIITSNGKTILDKNKGSELLIGIDMDEPSYAYMNDSSMLF